MPKPIEIEVRIAIIGEEKTLILIKDMISDFPNLKALFINYLYFENSRQDINTFLYGVEMVLFTEYRLYVNLKDRIKYSIPVHFMSPSNSEVYKKIYMIHTENKNKIVSLDSISQKHELSELKSHEKLIISNSNLSIDDYLKFHISNYKKQNAFVITFFSEISLKLNDLNIPNHLISPSKNDVIICLERAMLSSESRKNKESQVFMGIFSVSCGIDNYKEIEMVLNQYSNELDAHLVKSSENEFLLISTRGIFEKVSKGYKHFPLFDNLTHLDDVVLQVGIGFGYTALDSGNHARIALSQSIEFGPNCAFIVREDKVVFGPIQNTQYSPYQKYELTVKDPKIINIAKKANMSAIHMVKLMSKASKYKKKDYTSHDLAQFLDVTERSANRILLKWSDANLVSIIGEEKVSKKGRPRRLYHFNFLD